MIYLEIVYSHGTIAPEEVIKFLALTGQSAALFNEVIKRKEVIKKAEELGISVSDEELQQFADNFRTLHGLYDADATLNFLNSSGVSENDFERFCESAVLMSSLRNHLTDEKRVQDYFINNRSDFDVARVSVVTVQEKSLADEIMVQVIEEDADFHKLARQHSSDGATKYAGGYIGVVSRRMLSPEVAAKVFNASSGDVIGPYEQDRVYKLILVEEVVKAELNDEVRNAIKERIFSEWASQFLKEGVEIKI